MNMLALKDGNKIDWYSNDSAFFQAEMCYVARDYSAELETFSCSGENKARFDLPDGQHVLLSDERFKVPECIFKPSLEGLDCLGIPDLICSSVDKCDLDYRPIFYENIVVSGGSTRIDRTFGLRIDTTTRKEARCEDTYRCIGLEAVQRLGWRFSLGLFG